MHRPEQLVSTVKNAFGWKTNERLITFNVDDYGAIRLASREARDKLQQQITGFGGQMDTFDALETRDDLEALFDVLRRVRDSAGNPAIITAYALCANPDFKLLRKERRYEPESLAETFERLAAKQPVAYEGAWEAWQQGMKEGLLNPQFHGREHLNIPLIEAKLVRGEDDIEANLEVESMAGLRNIPEMPGVGFTHALGLHDAALLPQQREIIADGLARFEETFGFRSRTFTPPAQRLHPSLDNYIFNLGVEAIDKPFFTRRPLGNGKSRSALSFTRPPTRRRPGTFVRTLSFEPCSGIKSDPVGHAMRQIEIAFKWKKPAIVSSHRVNYSGHIDPQNRKRGLKALSELLNCIVGRWPDVKFVSSDDLLGRMEFAD